MLNPGWDAGLAARAKGRVMETGLVFRTQAEYTDAPVMRVNERKAAMADEVMALTDENFNDAVATGVALIDLWAPWCAPCMTQGPIVEKVAAAVGDKATVAKLNVDEGQSTAARFGIRAIPTLLLLKDGVEVKRFVGLQNEQTLVASIEDALE